MLITELTLYRKWYTALTTIGELYINGTKFCFVLEDVCRDLNRDGDLKDAGEIKVDGKTCIPAGRYQVIIDRSTRFKKDMPLLINVPGFGGIRIHNGNYAGDTDGCLLLGSSKSADFVGNSRDTFDRFFLRLKALLKTHKVYITIKDLPIPN
jgi:hypothetical protein